MGVFFKSDGTKMFLLGYVSSDATHEVLEYTLSTAWDVTTASFTSRLNVGLGANGLFFKPDGLKVYTAKSYLTDKAVLEYNIPTSKNLTLPSSVVGIPSATSDGDIVTLEFVTSDGGTTVNLIAENIISTV